MSEPGKPSDADACRAVLLTVLRDACDQEALARAGGYLFRYVREETVLRDCGQDAVCRTPPGCARHWEERCRELVAGARALRQQLEESAALAEERLAHSHALQADIEAEISGRLALRQRFGALEAETMGMFVERLASERDAARNQMSDELGLPRSMAPAPGEIRRMREAAKMWWERCAGCAACGCLVAGGPTACGRCVAVEAPHE